MDVSTGVFKITNVLWTDMARYSLVILKKVNWPVSSHMQVALRSVDLETAKKKLTPETFETFQQYLVNNKCNPRFETKIASMLGVFHFKHSNIVSHDTFYVLDFFPVFSDSLEYELSLTPRKSPVPNFLKTLVGKYNCASIQSFHGVYRTSRIPKQMIQWAANMQSDRQVRANVKRKYTKLVDWDNIAEKDIEMLSQFREPRMNNRSKLFMRHVLSDSIDKDTPKLLPFVYPHTLKIMAPYERRALVENIEADLGFAFDFDFKIPSANLFSLWYNHSVSQEFEDAVSFRAQLKNHMYGVCITGANKYIVSIKLKFKNYIGCSGTIGLPTDDDTEIRIVHAMRNDVSRYTRVVERFKDCEVFLGTPPVPTGDCVVAHSDDAIYWRQTADVDMVHCIGTFINTGKIKECKELTLYNAHKFDFQHFVLLQKHLPSVCKVAVSGRLDQFPTGRRGQLFRDLVVLKGISSVPKTNAFISNDLHFVQGVENIPDEVQQVFTSAYSKKYTDIEFNSSADAQYKNRFWLTHPKRVRTITYRNDSGRTVFREKDEPQTKITNLNRLEKADVVPLHRYNGRLLDCAAYIPDPDKTNEFNFYCVRSYARRIYYVNMATLPSNTGRLPSRRTLRHML